MIDHSKRQLEKARRERRQLLQKDVTFEQAQSNAKQNKYPVGSTYAWAAMCVFGPEGSAKKEE